MFLDKKQLRVYNINGGGGITARRAKGEGSIYKDKQGYWNAQILLGYSQNGKPKYKKFRGKKQGEVVEKMNNFKLCAGTASAAIVQSMALDNLINTYIETVKKVSIRSTSYDSVLVSANQVNEHLGYLSISNLTPEIIQTDLINKMIELDYAYGTIHKAYVILNECLNYAVFKDYITKNPCMGVKLPSKDNFEKKERRFLNDDEIQTFKAQACVSQSNFNIPKYVYGNIICLILYTGLRVGELSALKWKDIDFQHKILSVNKAVVVVYDYSAKPKKRTLTVQDTTKSGKPRVIPLNQKAIQILETQRSLFGGDDDCFIVNGTKQIPDKTVVANSYSKIARAAKIPDPSGIHTLRHTFASSAIRKGVDIKVVSEILGHASVTFTYNTYVHIIDEQKARAVELLNDI